ncbi:MAG: cation-translocating P-type ATPase [Candidatus Hodarchaeales archaeon]|jgi:Ca2+-transporting ATPase
MATETVSPDLTPFIAHDKPLNEVIEKLDSDISTGLSSDTLPDKKAKYGLNWIPPVKGSFWQVYLAPLFDVLITVYLIMTAILLIITGYLIFAINDYKNVTQAAQWLAIVLVNFGIAIVQQRRAQKKMDALQKLSVGRARIIRDGQVQESDVTELVPGDIIELEQGDAIPADGRLIHSSNFLVNEASLTGESVPASKTDDGTSPIKEDTPLGEQENMIFYGTFVQTGNGKAVIVNTGLRTELGRISSDLAEMNTGEIPLKRKVNVLGFYLAIGVVLFFSIKTLYTFWDLNREGKLDLSVKDNAALLAQRFIDNIVTAMSLMPINIPLLTTIVLLTGVLSMATHRVIIRNLSAVESLGRISVLSSDKTGTITRSQMTVKRIWDGNQLYGVTGLGYGPSGVIFPIEKKITAELNEKEMLPLDDLQLVIPDSPLELMLISGMLNNNAEILVEEVLEASGQTTFAATGSATDAALQALFNKATYNRVEILEKYPKVREYPFDSAVKRMSMVFQDGGDDYIVFCKGAAEVLIDRCDRIGYPNHEKEFTDELRQESKEMVNDFAALGFRVLTLTYRRVDSLPKKGIEQRNEIEQNLVYLGFVCVLDPPREGVKEAVEEAISAGVTPVMITGDSPVTAGTIARDVGIINKDYHEVHEGKLCETLPDESFFNTVVWARVSPKHKQIIIERYQNKAKVVAMTGDGVNDALALSMADAGICMGITGTDVAKQASDIVIADDSYVSIVTGIRQGRSLFQKIRIMIMFYIGVNAGAEALMYFLTSFSADFYYVSLWQRIYIFGIVHFIPPMAIIFDKQSADIMERDPIDTAGIFNKQLLFGMLSFSLVLATMGLTVYFITYDQVLLSVNSFNMDGFVPALQSDVDWDPDAFLVAKDWSQAKARTMLLTVLYIAESLFVLSIRRIDKSLIEAIKEDSFWFTYLCVFSMPVLHFLLMYLPFLQDLIGYGGITIDLIFLDPLDWLICIIAGLLPIVSLELYKANIRKQGKYF